MQTLQSATEEIMSLLARGAYRELMERCARSRVSIPELTRVIDEYGRTVLTPPPSAYSLLEAVPIEGTPNAWAVQMPLWTQEEGRSDLTVDLTITLRDGQADIEFDDIHVP